MTYLLTNTSSISTLRKQAGPSPVACGIWLRVGFIAASAFAVGLIELFDGNMKPLSALALAAVGAALAVFSARRARSALDDAADPVSAVDARSPARVLAS